MHLVGNLIIRAALTEPVLKAYLPSLWLFLSLSGPHLGYLCSANKLFCSGMWLFKKFTAGVLLHLSDFSDRTKLRTRSQPADISNSTFMSCTSGDADSHCIMFGDLNFKHLQIPTGGEVMAGRSCSTSALFLSSFASMLLEVGTCKHTDQLSRSLRFCQLDKACISKQVEGPDQRASCLRLVCSLFPFVQGWGASQVDQA